MAHFTRATKRIRDYLIRDESQTSTEILNDERETETETETQSVEDEEINSNENTPMAKRRRSEKPPRLLDGKYFEISSLEDTKVVAICTICRESRKGHIDSTGNFMKHIKRSHSELEQEVKEHLKCINTKDDGVQRKVQKTIEQTLTKKCTTEDVSCFNLYN